MQYSKKIKPQETVRHIVSWLKDYCENSKMKGFVIGVSGGIDSAVTSTLCALTDLPVLCLNMPIHQQSDQYQRSTEHIEWLKANHRNVEGLTVDLSSVFDVFSASVGDRKRSDEQRLLALANTRSRLRMTTLYQFAQENSFLVVGTGNKVEDFGIGFFTKYGDGGVDLSPIADLMKSEVYDLGQFLMVSSNIINARPTDGLWDDDRSDEDQIGATYDQMEWAMEYLDNNSSESDYTKTQSNVLQIFKSFNKKNSHKIIPIPVCQIPYSLRLSKE